MCVHFDHQKHCRYRPPHKPPAPPEPPVIVCEVQLKPRRRRSKSRPRGRTRSRSKLRFGIAQCICGLCFKVCYESKSIWSQVEVDHVDTFSAQSCAITSENRDIRIASLEENENRVHVLHIYLLMPALRKAHHFSNQILSYKERTQDPENLCWLSRLNLAGTELELFTKLKSSILNLQV